jgi:DUF1009 family protein
MKIGVLAGEGQLPVHVVAGAEAAGHPVRVVQLEGFGEAARFDVPTMSFTLGAFGAMTRWFRDHGVTHLSMAGNVSRPDFSKLKPDLKGLKKLPAIAAAGRKGDDALLQAVVAAFESEGFAILPPQQLAANLSAPEGHLGEHKSTYARDDIIKACETARGIGALDIGQAAVVAGGIVLAVEAQEGTANMLRRIVRLPEEVRGTPAARKGVLAKMLKPGQDGRVDLPTIGLETVELADRAGLAGIVVEAGAAFVLDRKAAVAHADAAGLFILGLPRS